MVTEAMVTNLIDKGRDQGYLLSDEVVAAFPNAEEHLDVLEDFTPRWWPKESRSSTKPR